jgi:diamine N-acetyltransferase
MAVRLDAVTPENYEAVINLQVDDGQQEFVGLVTEFLARCYVKSPGYSYFPFAIYHDTDVVGFALYMAIMESPDKHYVSGFLIDKRHQNRGYGRQALLQLLRFISAQPYCRKITVSCHPDNIVAQRLYESLGFRDQGWRLDGEVVSAVDVSDLDLS